MAEPQNATATPSAPPIDLSGGLVPKVPASTVDLSGGLVPKNNSDVSTIGGPPQLDISKSPDPLAGRYQAYSELGRGAIKGAKETARTVGGWLGEAFGSPNVKPEDQPLAPFKNQDLE